MLRQAVVALSLLALSVAAVDVPFKNCGTDADRLKVKSVSANAWPPQRGKDLALEVKGDLKDEPVKGGTYHLEVQFEGIPLITKDGDITELGLVKFPIQPGPITIKRSEGVPDIMPAGHYIIQLKLTDEQSVQLLCASLETDVKDDAGKDEKES